MLKRYYLEADDLFELDTRALIARTVLNPVDSNVDRLDDRTSDYRLRFEDQEMRRETLARAYWTIGEVFLGRSQAVPIEPDSPQLERTLELKASLLLRAQDAYMRTVKSLDPQWATAAVFRIGYAYESFYGDLVSAPAPKNLRGVERQTYIEEVRDALKPVKHKAVMAYERIIRFSQQYSLETEWVERAERRLVRLRSLRLPMPTSDQG